MIIVVIIVQFCKVVVWNSDSTKVLWKSMLQAQILLIVNRVIICVFTIILLMFYNYTCIYILPTHQSWQQTCQCSVTQPTYRKFTRSCETVPPGQFQVSRVWPSLHGASPSDSFHSTLRQRVSAMLFFSTRGMPC